MLDDALHIISNVSERFPTIPVSGLNRLRRFRQLVTNDSASYPYESSKDGANDGYEAND